jgi:ribosomal protein S18 acetylase RimI-like enzyme
MRRGSSGVRNASADGKPRTVQRMTLAIRRFEDADEAAVIALWRAAGLTRPWNDPHADIQRKRAVQPELFLVGEVDGAIVATAMAGYDGHRGSVYYLAVSPAHHRAGYGRALMADIERRLEALGCPKLNLMVRGDNRAAIGFYDRLGYEAADVVTLGKRLIADPPP